MRRQVQALADLLVGQAAAQRVSVGARVSVLRLIRTTRNNSYDVNAAFMSSQRRESGIHVVSEARDRRAGLLPEGCCCRGGVKAGPRG
jgi:hypothetical protein